MGSRANGGMARPGRRPDIRLEVPPPPSARTVRSAGSSNLPGRDGPCCPDRPDPIATNKEDKDVLNGQTAIVTGSTSGIGLGIARALAKAGANVVLNGF